MPPPNTAPNPTTTRTRWTTVLPTTERATRTPATEQLSEEQSRPESWLS